MQQRDVSTDDDLVTEAMPDELKHAIATLSEADKTDVLDAVKDAVGAYARDPSSANAVKVEATLWALQLNKRAAR